MLGEKYPGVEIFVFGGEPFVHPHIGYIIQCFNEFKIPFVIQTNFSSHSRKIMRTITDPYLINISVHPTETSIEDICLGLRDTGASIKTIDVMYTGDEAIAYYLAIKQAIDHDETYLTPVTDFGDGYSDTLLAKYLEIREHPIYSKIIKFEDVERYGQQRSKLWLDPEFKTLGKPCLYKDRYFLYGPNMELYNCCYRIKTDGTCPKNKCFLM
jgi:hypothetical protein